MRKPARKLQEVKNLYYYPDNMTSKATMWLWKLRDIAVIGIGLLLSILALTRTGLMFPLIITPVYAFLSIRSDSVCIPDFIRYASVSFLLMPQFYEWRPRCVLTD